MLAKIPANFVAPILNSLIVFGLEVSDDKGHLKDKLILKVIWSKLVYQSSFTLI